MAYSVLDRALRAGGIATLLAVTGASPLVAQRALVPTGTQDLQFGTVIPGLPTVISRLDAGNAGKYQIRGERRTEVRVDLTLPPTLVSTTTSATMPLLFGPNDGGFSGSPSIGSSQPFDPQQPLINALSNSGRLYLFLGGTVTPTPLQEAGTYQATVTMTVVYTGNE